MSYEPAAIPNLAPDETGYLLDGTDYVAARFSRGADAAADIFSITACAFAVNPDGTPRLTHAGGAIEGWHTHGCKQVELLTGNALDPAKVAEVKRAAQEAAFDAVRGVIAAEAAYRSMGV